MLINIFTVVDRALLAKKRMIRRAGSKTDGSSISKQSAILPISGLFIEISCAVSFNSHKLPRSRNRTALSGMGTMVLSEVSKSRTYKLLNPRSLERI
jgi:hypothetical protein